MTLLLKNRLVNNGYLIPATQKSANFYVPDLGVSPLSFNLIGVDFIALVLDF